MWNTSRRAALLMLGLAFAAPVAAQSDAMAENAAPVEIRAAEELVRKLIPLDTSMAQAQERLAAHGLFCTAGGHPVIDGSFASSWVFCAPSCGGAVRDGWWVLLRAPDFRGVESITVWSNTSSYGIKPFIPRGCPDRKI